MPLDKGRLFDVLSQSAPVSPYNGSAQLSPILTSGEIILVDNVADYFFDFLPDDEEAQRKGVTMPWDYDRHYAFCAPPFDEMWFEYRTTKLINIKRIGVRVTSVEMTLDRWPMVDTRLHESLVDAHPELHDRVRWLLSFEPYTERENGRLEGPWGTFLIGIAPDGRIAKNADGDYVFAVSAIDPARAAKHQSTMVNPCLMAMTFMNVKNSRLLVEEPPKPRTRNQQKKARRFPASRYYVLKIDPVDRILQNRATNDESERTEQALHIVRGHPADYREHGLFGKYKGIFWIPAHTRGSPEHGVIEKDYEFTGDLSNPGPDAA
jgi:hypothetical protein